MQQPAVYGQPGAPPAVVRQQIVTLRFNGAAPPPHPACLEPTPVEEYQMAEQQRMLQQQQKDLARQQEADAAPPAQKASAFFKVVQLASSVATAVEKVAVDAHSKGEKAVRDLVAGKNQERFAINFPELVAAGEQLICDYSCRVMSQGQAFSGNLQVTTRHLCFTGDVLREIIPFAEIASIQKSISLPTIDNGPPFIMPIPAPHVLFDTLQVFTVRQQLFQFLSFESHVAKAGAVLTTTLKGRPIDRAYNFVDHAWRAATPVPLQGVQYAQY